ncbi:hypothetical protein [Magnetofaba australis]|nr:hypothetical protein [Magnetofaba australis]
MAPSNCGGQGQMGHQGMMPPPQNGMNQGQMGRMGQQGQMPPPPPDMQQSNQ